MIKIICFISGGILGLYLLNLYLAWRHKITTKKILDKYKVEL